MRLVNKLVLVGAVLVGAMASASAESRRVIRGDIHGDRGIQRVDDWDSYDDWRHGPLRPGGIYGGGHRECRKSSVSRKTDELLWSLKRFEKLVRYTPRDRLKDDIKEAIDKVESFKGKIYRYRCGKLEDRLQSVKRAINGLKHTIEDIKDRSQCRASRHGRDDDRWPRRGHSYGYGYGYDYGDDYGYVGGRPQYARCFRVLGILSHFRSVDHSLRDLSRSL